MLRRPRRSPPFPYTTLSGSVVDLGSGVSLPAGAVRLLGSPPHGAVLLPGDPALPSDLVPERGLLLVPVQPVPRRAARRSAEHTSELQSRQYLVCRLLLETNE